MEKAGSRRIRLEGSERSSGAAGGAASTPNLPMYPFPESKAVEMGAVQSLGEFHFLLPCSDQVTGSQREGMVRGYSEERGHAAQEETRSFLPVQ